MGIKHTSSQIGQDKIRQYWEDILFFIGDNPKREGLKKTPDRIIESWKEIFDGYRQDPQRILSKAQFQDGCCNEMVILRDVKDYSTCEHHFLPFSFTAHVGYIPNGKLVGISKLARVVRCFAKRLQIQEKMTSEIADAIQRALKPKGVMVVIEGSHLCLLCRGVRQDKSILITSAIRGTFVNQAPRNEFLDLIKR